MASTKGPQIYFVLQTLTLTVWRPLLPYGYSSGLSVRVPGCQKLQMMAQPGLAQNAL